MTPRSDDDLFDADVIADAADEFDVDARSLADVTRRHQQSMDALPGVENLAYEWRKHYDSKLFERTEAAYYLAVPVWVWDEFGESLELRERMLEALIEVHRIAVSTQTDSGSEPPEGLSYIALNRRVGVD